MAESILILLCIIALYHHVGFPLILKWIKPDAVEIAPKHQSWPSISLIVPAYNEAHTIGDKILNTAWLDYPAERLELIIACDGCSDQTHDVVQQTLQKKQLRHLDVKVFNFAQNRGKVAVLNEVMAKARGEIMAFSDSSSLISLDGLKRVAAHFDHPCVGVVGGTYHFADQTHSAEDSYWRYQRAIKKGEAHLGAPMGLHGAFYAVRKTLASPLPANTINDDFTLPMKIVAKGYRAIYDDQIRCVETEATTDTMNWKRRVRISAGNLQQAIQCVDLLSLKQPGIAFCFFSGKFLRAWMALILVAIFALTIHVSWDHGPARFFLAAQIFGLCLAFLPLSRSSKLGKICQLLRYLVIGHLAGFVGTIRYFCALENGAWKRAH